MKIAAIQMAVGQDKMENVMRAGRYLEQAAAQGADLAVLPEMFCCPYQTELFPVYAEREGQETWKMLAGYAKTHGIYLVAGSMPELGDDNRVYNTSYVFDRRGRQIGKHRKVHLFDIDVEGGQYFKESNTLWAGEGMTLFETEFGTMGLCICFDIRFPELFGQMAAGGARMVFVPAAFNMTTGPAHWELLNRARAVDAQVYVAGTDVAYREDAPFVSHGCSCICDPWGNVVEQAGKEETMISAQIDTEVTEKMRRNLIVLKHQPVTENVPVAAAVEPAAVPKA